MLRLALVAVLAAGCAAPGGGPEPVAADAARSAAAFQTLVGLAGSWEGEKSTVDYRVTAGGSAVEEVIFRGTKHEMVTMYHLDGGRLLLTHYCAAGNQPTMVLLPGSDPAILEFDFLRGTNMQPTDGHMHQARFDVTSPDTLKTAWTFWEKGTPGHQATFELHRAK
jgi:hypothetical protein